MRARRIVVISSFACALAVLGSRPCFAGQDALTDKAATLYDEGMVAYNKGKWPEARASFLAAWSLKNHWQIAASLGDCEAQLGLFREAAGHLAYFLRLAPSDRRTPKISGLYDLARSKVATLAISVDAREADVAVDGKVLGKAPLEDPVFVEPGHHLIEARSGAKIASAAVDVVAGDRREVALAPTASEPRPVPVASTGGPGWGWVIGSGVVAVAGLAAGAGLTIAANGKASDASSLRAQLKSSSACTPSPAPSPCPALSSAVSSKNTLSNAAVGTFVVGGVFALATVGLGAWQGATRKATTAIRVVPFASGSDGGVVVVGTW